MCIVSESLGMGQKSSMSSVSRAGSNPPISWLKNRNVLERSWELSSLSIASGIGASRVSTAFPAPSASLSRVPDAASSLVP